MFCNPLLRCKYIIKKIVGNKKLFENIPTLNVIKVYNVIYCVKRQSCSSIYLMNVT